MRPKYTLCILAQKDIELHTPYCTRLYRTEAIPQMGSKCISYTRAQGNMEVRAPLTVGAHLVSIYLLKGY